MTNGCDRLVAFKKSADKLHGFRIEPKLIRIGDAAWQHERVVVFRVGQVERNVEGKLLAWFVIDDRLDFRGLRGRDELGSRPGVFEGLARFRELRLLNSVGAQDGDIFPGE